MKVYVASKFQNQQAVREAMAAFREAGHEITLDWTAFDDTHLVAQASKHTAKSSAHNEAMRRLDDFHAHCARSDIQAVREANVFVMLLADNMKGAWIELGVALARTHGLFVERPRIFVVGDWTKYDTVFLHLPEVQRVATVAEVIAALKPPRPALTSAPRLSTEE